MITQPPPQETIILALATWRLASLFANENGPFHIIKNFREWVCENHPGIGEGLTCEWCNSVWFGILLTIAYVILGRIAALVCLPLALSAFAVFWKYVVQSKQKYVDQKGGQ